jgi:hypothetical protein
MPNTTPYVGNAEELAEVAAKMAFEVLWRRCGYSERKPTPDDVATVLAGLDAAKAAFLVRCAPHVVIDGKPNLQLVKDAS